MTINGVQGGVWRHDVVQERGGGGFVGKTLACAGGRGGGGGGGFGDMNMS